MGSSAGGGWHLSSSGRFQRITAPRAGPSAAPSQITFPDQHITVPRPAPEPPASSARPEAAAPGAGGGPSEEASGAPDSGAAGPGSDGGAGAGNVLTRIGGGLQVVGGIAEALGALALFAAPDPTLATKVGGAVLAVHSVDTITAGLRTLWTGERTNTLTHQAAAGVAKHLGASDATANRLGVAADILIPLGAGAVGAISRVAAARAAQRGLPLLSQTTASATFRNGPFAGRTIGDVAAAVRSGATLPSELPIEVIVRNGQMIGLNTRSMLALRRAGVPTSQWVIKNLTGNAEAEAALTQRLIRNGLSGGTEVLRITGGGSTMSVIK